MKEKIFTIEEIRKILAIPQNYKMSYPDRRILCQIMEDLSIFFPDLKIEKIETGMKITGVKFTWDEKKA